MTYPPINFFPGVAAEDLPRLSDDEAERKALQKQALSLIAAVSRGEIQGQECGWMDETGNLSDCRKLYFDLDENRELRYRLVYRFLPDESFVQSIEVIAIGLKGSLRDLDPEYIYTLVGKRLGRIR